MPESDTGTSSADNITNLNNHDSANRLLFSVVSTVPGALITVLADGVAIGSAVASGNTTTVTTNGSLALADGIRSITARQTEQNKAASAPSSALNITIDTTPPRSPGKPPLPPPTKPAGTAQTYPFHSQPPTLSGVAGSVPASPLVLTAEGSAVTADDFLLMDYAFLQQHGKV